MVDINSVNYDLGRKIKSERAASADYKGNVHPMNDSVVFASAAADTDALAGDLSVASKVLPSSRVVFEALGASTTIGVALRTADGTLTPVFAAADSSSAGETVFAAADIGTFPVQALDAAGIPAASTIVIQLKGGTGTGTVKTFIDYGE